MLVYLSRLFSHALSFFIKRKLFFPVFLLILLNIKERNDDGKDHIFFSRPKGRITILALDSKRYRGDLDALAKNKKFRVLHLSQRPPGWLQKPFYKDFELKKYINSKDGSAEEKIHKEALKFTIEFLNYFYNFLSVDCVTTVNYRYFEDHNWTKASNIIGVPFIMLYRECLLAVERVYDEIFLRTRDRFGSFHGEHIIVHNEITKKVFESSGFCDKNKISVCGALRMDEFLINISKNYSRDYVNKTFTFFYFPHNMSVFGRDGEDVCHEKYQYHSTEWEFRDNLFTDLHNCIIELAVLNPDVNFIIKPKLEMVKHKTWAYYENIINNSNTEIKNLKNYHVLPEANVHELILSSDVICAFQSSTALEAAIANKRVIFPLFYDFKNTPYIDNFLWGKQTHLFDVALDTEHFKKLFYQALDQPSVNKNILKERIDVFEKFFDSFDGVALEKYSKVIENVVSAK